MRGSEETPKQTVIFHVYRAVAWLGRTLPERFGRRCSGSVGCWRTI